MCFMLQYHKSLTVLNTGCVHPSQSVLCCSPLSHHWLEIWYYYQFNTFSPTTQFLFPTVLEWLHFYKIFRNLQLWYVYLHINSDRSFPSYVETYSFLLRSHTEVPNSLYKYGKNFLKGDKTKSQDHSIITDETNTILEVRIKGMGS